MNPSFSIDTVCDLLEAHELSPYEVISKEKYEALMLDAWDCSSEMGDWLFCQFTQENNSYIMIPFSWSDLEDEYLKFFGIKKPGYFDNVDVSILTKSEDQLEKEMNVVKIPKYNLLNLCAIETK